MPRFVVWIHQKGRSVRAALPPFNAEDARAADVEARRLAGSYAFAVRLPSAETQKPKTEPK